MLTHLFIGRCQIHPHVVIVVVVIGILTCYRSFGTVLLQGNDTLAFVWGCVLVVVANGSVNTDRANARLSERSGVGGMENVRKVTVSIRPRRGGKVRKGDRARITGVSRVRKSVHAVGLAIDACVRSGRKEEFMHDST